MIVKYLVITPRRKYDKIVFEQSFRPRVEAGRASVAKTLYQKWGKKKRREKTKIWG